VGLAVLAAAPASGAQTLGRLFLTPEQRVELDQIRADPDWGKVAEPEVVVETEVEGVQGPVVPNVTINGVVFRSSGINASWINGHSVPSSDSTREGIRIETRRLSGGGSVRLGLPGGLQTVQLKPGQKIDLTSGGVFEPYEYKAEEDAPLFEESEDGAASVPSETDESTGALLDETTE
jgi:hypothetical protein